MDTQPAAVQLCLAGTRAEFEKRYEDAWALYRQAWQTAGDDYEACVAAHYMARSDPAQALQWNQEALRRADLVRDGRADEFYPSLYLNLGQSYERCGDTAKAQHYYGLAAGLGFAHQPDE